MSSVFPGALDDLSPAGKTNSTPAVDDHPAHHNLLADATEKIENELGVNPSGSAATVADRLTTIEAGLAIPGEARMWFSNTPPSGWAICDGSTITNAQTNNPALWANIDAAWKSGSDIILPDLRGRVPVGKGTHTDVSTLGNNDGLATGSRRPAHKHTAGLGTLATGNDTPDHAHTFTIDAGGAGGAIARSTVAGGAQVGQGTSGASARHTHPVTGAPTVGPQTGSEPTDTPAHVVVNWIIKL
jgi:microcystin-dependent protein